MAETDEASEHDDEPDQGSDRAVTCTLSEEGVSVRRDYVREHVLPHYEGVTERADGYDLTFAGTADALEAVAAIVGKEARCCSFATFQIAYEPPYDEVVLSVTGPSGTRDLAREGFFEAFDEVTPPS